MGRKPRFHAGTLLVCNRHFPGSRAQLPHLEQVRNRDDVGMLVWPTLVAPARTVAATGSVRPQNVVWHPIEAAARPTQCGTPGHGACCWARAIRNGVHLILNSSTNEVLLLTNAEGCGVCRTPLRSQLIARSAVAAPALVVGALLDTTRGRLVAAAAAGPVLCAARADCRAGRCCCWPSGPCMPLRRMMPARGVVSCRAPRNSAFGGWQSATVDGRQ